MYGLLTVITLLWFDLERQLQRMEQRGGIVKTRNIQ